MDQIPEFDDRGLLPPGDYEVTFDELRDSILVTGPTVLPIPAWDVAWRRRLVNQAELLIRQLWKVGISGVFLDGSFAEDKPHPNDIDGYFVCDVRELASGELQRKLNALDPHSIWTWDPKARRAYRGYPKRQLPMWHVYRVELYPHFGQPSGLRDRHGNPLIFPAAFRRQRTTDESKGILKIIPSR